MSKIMFSASSGQNLFFEENLNEESLVVMSGGVFNSDFLDSLNLNNETNGLEHASHAVSSTSMIATAIEPEEKVIVEANHYYELTNSKRFCIFSIDKFTISDCLLDLVNRYNAINKNEDKSEDIRPGLGREINKLFYELYHLDKSKLTKIDDDLVWSVLDCLLTDLVELTLYKSKVNLPQKSNSKEFDLIRHQKAESIIEKLNSLSKSYGQARLENLIELKKFKRRLYWFREKAARIEKTKDQENGKRKLDSVSQQQDETSTANVDTNHQVSTTQIVMPGTFFSRASSDLTARVQAAKRRSLELDHAKAVLQASIAKETIELESKKSRLASLSPASFAAVLVRQSETLKNAESVNETLESLAAFTLLEEYLATCNKAVADKQSEINAIIDLEKRLALQNRLVDEELAKVAAVAKQVPTKP